MNDRADGITSDKRTGTAAAYVRMSTEHQRYSTSNQMDVIRDYAAKRGHEIVTTYSDEGKSGLSIAGRDALASMIADVESGSAGFESILVYDVSRWGRFQDADESAYYEFVCRRAGIAVHYCAEQFENDGSPVSAIVKSVKRTMAGEYSRELSAKVFQGACRLIQLGFKQGGTAGYGLRRMLVDQAGRHKGVLARGEHKSIQTDRVILVPGPDDEVATVRWAFRKFVEEGQTEGEIAAALNSQGVPTDLGREWNRSTVRQLLTNEKYIGNNVYHRTSFKLKKRHVRNGPEQWVRARGVWSPVVEEELFRQAGLIILERSRHYTDEQLLEELRSLLKLHGRVSGILIDEREDFPSSAVYRHRFGSLIKAYSLIGYTPSTNYRFIEDNRRIRGMHPEIVAEVIQKLEAVGATVERELPNGLLRVSGEMLVSLVICRHTSTTGGASRWAIRLDTGLRPDLTIAVRLEVGNSTIRDYYLLPSIDMTWDRLRIADANGIELDGYQFDDLSFFFRMAERTNIDNLS